MHLTFDAVKVRALIEISKASAERRVNFEQHAETGFWREDMDPDRRATLVKELEDHGYVPSIKDEDCDPRKIPAGLWLVGDQGVYIMANVPVTPETRASGDHVVYAAECDPTKLPFDEWYDNKRRIFGGDDGSEFLPAEMIEKALSSGPAKLIVDIDAESVSVIHEYEILHRISPVTDEGPGTS
ncbi:DUF3085 domain-containing protein [Pseudosulfitobacter pseudonitzschiae]|uniref:DUF3085 domain-containing protein n=1 Tax=Pseudosulfitobacter pseudonitzschiae TaxID=1402135 RepID=UPI003B7A6AC7